VFGFRGNGIACRSSDLDPAISSPEATPVEWAELFDALENAPIIYALEIVRPERVANEPTQSKNCARRRNDLPRER
jgi:hypothetical protein